MRDTIRQEKTASWEAVALWPHPPVPLVVGQDHGEPVGSFLESWKERMSGGKGFRLLHRFGVVVCPSDEAVESRHEKEGAELAAVVA
ncbi:hypothetical protein DPQ33_12250 [Oceanidesulfovibrio indonesiensis]|uniref:Uncharacterized protein n=1 Tax=Oceanidesulfovibrio indonesiensis TaxID=54767 RepID=A0A7M3MDZ5_9BACT|nr:hypothetical protein DPQ33_12250 [Oceanidesulfovibrio indonesiensis]